MVGLEYVVSDRPNNNTSQQPPHPQSNTLLHSFRISKNGEEMYTITAYCSIYGFLCPVKEWDLTVKRV